jgi:radical S-adenosyl methionine domain-containing protein 2
MAHIMQKLDPFGWKGFQVLLVTGENASDKVRKDATRYIVTDELHENPAVL